MTKNEQNNDFLELVKLFFEKSGLPYEKIETKTIDGIDVNLVEVYSNTLNLKKDTIDKINLLIKQIAKNRGIDSYYFVDINERNLRHLEKIKRAALILAQRAASFKTNLELKPMTAYERFLIHKILEDKENITTKSKGEGKNRRVVIYYQESDSSDSDFVL